MSVRRVIPVFALTSVLGLAPISAALAQVCIGLPARDGEMSIQGSVLGNADEGGTGYGGRLGINFDTPMSLDGSLERPRFDNGRLGTSLAGILAYEIYDYEPSV